jgi:hypothetical protein
MDKIVFGFIIFLIFIYFRIAKEVVGYYKNFKNRNRSSLKKKEQKVSWWETILVYVGTAIGFYFFIKVSTIFAYSAIMITFIGFLVFFDLEVQKRNLNQINSKIYKFVKIPITLAVTPIFLHISFLIVYGPEATWLFGNNWQYSLMGFIALSSLITLSLLIFLLYIIWEIIKAKEKIALSVFGVVMGFLCIFLFYGWTTYLGYSTLHNDVQFYEGNCKVSYDFNTTRKLTHVNNYKLTFVDWSLHDSVAISNYTAHDLMDHNVCEKNIKVKVYYTTPLGGALSVTYNPDELINQSTN